MKTIAFNLTLLACLTMLPFTANADDRYGRDGWSIGGIEFRLGGYRGGSRGYEIYFRYRDGRGWRRGRGWSSGRAAQSLSF